MDLVVRAGCQPDDTPCLQAAILHIAKAITGHKHLSNLSLANQRNVLSTKALQSMLDAIETVPTLRSLNLGTVRDAGMRWRLQSVTSANMERIRKVRGFLLHLHPAEFAINISQTIPCNPPGYGISLHAIHDQLV